MKPTTKKTSAFTIFQVASISKLANIPITNEEKSKLALGFTDTMKVVDHLFSVNVKGVPPTNQVTGLKNIMREDEVDTTRIFTQKQALLNAPKTDKGYFVIDQILEEK